MLALGTLSAFAQTTRKQTSVLPELRAMVRADQAQRQGLDEDPAKSIKADEVRRHRVLALLAQGQLQTAEAKECAALILQHTPGYRMSEGSLQEANAEFYLLAHLLAKSAAEAGRRSARWLAAAALDRYLVGVGKPQKYGTQWNIDLKTGKKTVPPVDPATTDVERAAWDVEPLKRFLANVEAAEPPPLAKQP